MVTWTYFGSRTFWTLVAIFVVNGGNALVPMISPAFQGILTTLLAMLTMYFHVNPSQQYNTGNIK